MLSSAVRTLNIITEITVDKMRKMCEEVIRAINLNKICLPIKFHVSSLADLIIFFLVRRDLVLYVFFTSDNKASLMPYS